MAAPTPQGFRDLRPLRGERKINSLLAPLRHLLGIVGGERLDFGIREVRHERRHLLRLPNLLAHEDELIDGEQRRLASDRGNALELGIAGLAMATGAYPQPSFGGLWP